MSQKTVEKLSKYQDLQIEIDKMWHTTSKLTKCGTLHLRLFLSFSERDSTHYLSLINVPKSMVAAMQKSALLSILRRYSNM